MIKCGDEVQVYEWVKEVGKSIGRTYKCLAVFHKFGVDYEEFENGGCSFSTAIVEYSNGKFGNVPVEMIENNQRGGDNK
jgi:hypothetical protein